MNAVERSIAIIRPKAPFMKWVNSRSADGRKFTSESFREDCTILLIPESEISLEARGYVNKLWDEIFQFELEKWEDIISV